MNLMRYISPPWSNVVDDLRHTIADTTTEFLKIRTISSSQQDDDNSLLFDTRNPRS